MKKIIVALMCLMLASCAAGDLDGLNHKQRGVLFADVWAAQYDAYIDSQEDLLLTSDERQIMRVKRDILVESKPWLVLYLSYAERGVVPPDELADNLTMAITKLIKLTAGGD